jgi:hypothetical protein
LLDGDRARNGRPSRAVRDDALMDHEERFEAGATRAHLRRGDQELTAAVQEGAYWFIRRRVLERRGRWKIIRFASG